jgi:hypothetical protein
MFFYLIFLLLHGLGAHGSKPIFPQQFRMDITINQEDYRKAMKGYGTAFFDTELNRFAAYMVYTDEALKDYYNIKTIYSDGIIYRIDLATGECFIESAGFGGILNLFSFNGFDNTGIRWLKRNSRIFR